MTSPCKEFEITRRVRGCCHFFLNSRGTKATAIVRKAEGTERIYWILHTRHRRDSWFYGLPFPFWPGNKAVWWENSSSRTVMTTTQLCTCQICQHALSFAQYNQQDATFHNLFISVRRSTCFRRVFRPSSGARNCTYSVRHLSDRYCNLLLAVQASSR